MRCALRLHPDFRCDAVRAIEVDVVLAAPAELSLRYHVLGDIHALRLPPTAASERADELWRRTCLEAFARDADGEGYVEVNLSPSTRWASYRFDSYRHGMRPSAAVPREIKVSQTAEGLVLGAVLSLPHRAARLGLSAVIEDASGRLSYWALQHPPGRPDFHHVDGFALRLPAPSAP